MDVVYQVLGYAVLLTLSGVAIRAVVFILASPFHAQRAAREKAVLQTFETLNGFSPSFSLVNQKRQGIAIDLQTGQFAVLIGDPDRRTPKLFPRSVLCECTAWYDGSIRLTLDDNQLKAYEMAEANRDYVNSIGILLQTFIGTSYHLSRDIKYKPSYLETIEDVRRMEPDPKNMRIARLNAMVAFIESSPFAEDEYVITHYDFLNVLTNRGLWSMGESSHDVTNVRWANVASVSAVRIDEFVADVVLTLGSGEERTLPRWLHGAVHALDLIARRWKSGDLRDVAPAPAPKVPRQVSGGGLRRCLQCGNRVLPLADGRCPACQAPMS